MPTTGFMIAPSWISKSTLESTSSYDIGNWPVQADMTNGRIWMRPGNTVDVVRAVAEISTSIDGRSGGYGKAEFTIPLMNLSPKMVKYIRTIFFNNGLNWSCDVTVRLFNRESGDWEVYQAIMKRPDVGGEAQISAGGYTDYQLKCIEGELLT